MLAVMENAKPQRRPVGRPADPNRPRLSKDDPRYQPTRADLEEDMRVDASFEELVDAMFDRRPPRRVLHWSRQPATFSHRR